MFADRNRINLHHAPVFKQRDLPVRKTDHDPPRSAFRENLRGRRHQNRQES